ncbi:MAG: hypothetical protein ACD_22C00040G0003 [uncultured bacterium]|nr:MAG: hypothetical protein ACD_22C00040G0003 [uncultured bacterium]
MEKFHDRFFEEVREKFKAKGITTLLFDFDDTLVYTQEKFIKYMAEYISTVAEETGLAVEVVDEALRRLNDQEYKKMGVNPERWLAVAEKMVVEFGGYESEIFGNVDILMKIYQEEPRIKPGVEAILEIAKRSGLRMALVTHANVEWTQRKLESTGLAEFFDLIKIVDENKHKSIEDWLEVVNEMRVFPGECLVLGDSLSGDIIPAAQMGAKTMWLHNGSSWSMYRMGSVPDGTVHLDDIENLLSALEGLG